jgi:hypothetical protein
VLGHRVFFTNLACINNKWTNGRPRLNKKNGRPRILPKSMPLKKSYATIVTFATYKRAKLKEGRRRERHVTVIRLQHHWWRGVPRSLSCSNITEFEVLDFWVGLMHLGPGQVPLQNYFLPWLFLVHRSFSVSSFCSEIPWWYCGVLFSINEVLYRIFYDMTKNLWRKREYRFYLDETGCTLFKKNKTT